MDEIYKNIPQIGAEMLLNYLYPEFEDQWLVDDKGCFFRNYNTDILYLYPEEKRVELSRDSFLKLLPQGLLISDDNLKKSKNLAARTKELERKQHLLDEAFLPLNSMHFRRTLRIERQLAEVQSSKLEYVLKQYFGFDLAAETNPYVRQMAVLLPFAKQLRGDFQWLRSVMETLFKCRVTLTEGRYSESDSNVRWLPLVRYDLLIPGLDSETYRKLFSELQPFIDFVNEWLMPAEVVCQIKIKEYDQPQQTNTRLTLDYNTQIIQ